MRYTSLEEQCKAVFIANHCRKPVTGVLDNKLERPGVGVHDIDGTHHQPAITPRRRHHGHAFDAGFMCALCHDKRIMRNDRGFAYANEVEIGMVIPQPELVLIRHKLPMNVFFETVQQARRWTGPDALAAGIVHSTHDLAGQYRSLLIVTAPHGLSSGHFARHKLAPILHIFIRE